MYKNTDLPISSVGYRFLKTEECLIFSVLKKIPVSLALIKITFRSLACWLEWLLGAYLKTFRNGKGSWCAK